jgi:G:T/U-mismatch repair DNA glycosylase
MHLHPLQQGLPPVTGPNTYLLIPGSLPGEATLAVQAYYAHPRNFYETRASS